MIQQPTAILSGYLLSGDDVARKHPFVVAFVEGFRAAGWNVRIIENGAPEQRVLDLPENVEVSYCCEYGFKLHKRLSKSPRPYLKPLARLLFLLRRPSADCWEILKAEAIIADGNARARGHSRIGAALRSLLAFDGIQRVVAKSGPQAGDFLLTFLDLPTLQSLLRLQATKCGAQRAVMEYGELQNCMFYSERGLFHEAWPVLDSELFRSLPLSQTETEVAKKWRDKLCSERISNKTYDGSIVDLAKWKNGRPLIFLPALTPVGSCLYPRETRRSHEVSPFFDDNEDMLGELARVAISRGWCVVFKDHPNTYKYYSHLLTRRESDADLLVAENVDVHDILDHADVTLTLGGKTAFVSLMRGVPVVLAGPFTLSGSGLVTELSARTQLGEAIEQAIKGPGVEMDALDSFNARLIRYYLFRHKNEPDGIFPRGPEDAVRCLIDFAEGRRRLVSYDTSDSPGLTPTTPTAQIS